jgi:hypothetical protein
MKKFLYWLPRVLSILFIGFISLFALDVFGQPNWFLAFIIHLIPSLILIILTVIAWRNELWGGILFLTIGLVLLLLSGYEALILIIPTLVIGIFFLLSKRMAIKSNKKRG